MEGKPEDLAADLEALGPTFIKVGQMLASRPDLLPPPYIDALSKLHDDVGPFSYEEVEQIMSDELGVRIYAAFDQFEQKPIAAASLGQVHRARLRDGRAVAVKVLRPDIRGIVRRDLEVFDEIAGALELHGLLEKLPRRINALLDAVTERKLRLDPGYAGLEPRQ